LQAVPYFIAVETFKHPSVFQIQPFLLKTVNTFNQQPVANQKERGYF